MRKTERIQKKALRNGPPPRKQLKSRHENERSNLQDDAPVVNKTAKTKPAVPDAENASQQPKSILKRTKKPDPNISRSISPPVKISKSIKVKLARDDDEIAALEKKLGLVGKKKLPQSFKDDGLDELLEGLDGGEGSFALETKKRKSEGDDWLEDKRRKALKLTREGSSSDESESLEADDDFDDLEEGPDISSVDSDFPDDDSGDSGWPKSEGQNDTSNDGDEFGGFESEDDNSVSHTAPPRVRENPYTAPSVTGNPSAKYIPPSLRKAPSSDSESLVRLRRQTQGLVNRLTEANLISILAEIEKLYRDNARQHVTSTLVDLLLTSVCEPTSLPDTLIILPAGFIAAIYKIIGTDFGAQVIQRIVQLFDENYARAIAAAQNGPALATSNISKETSNLIMLLSEMYNFQIIGSKLIFDYIKMFLLELSELNAELLLKIIRTSGPQLRTDDPSSLKDIVAMLRPAIASIGEENISIRTKFMIETINDLKNNRMKTGAGSSAVTSEHTIRMKKILGSLNTRSIRGSEPLRIGLKDIQESDKKGKWWLVGASWSGLATDEAFEPKANLFDKGSGLPVEESGISDLAQLAKEQRMNTDVRRSVFVAMMSASDYQDAYTRLMKLNLKRKQEFEIPKVLIHCAGAEKNYNPYYTLIAKKLCGDVKLRKSFQFSLWDLFSNMGETGDDERVTEEEEEDSLNMRQMVNLAKMFATLIVEGGLGLVILNKLDLTYLQPKTKTFLEVLLITIFLQSQRQSATNERDEEAVRSIFAKLRDNPHLVRGLQYFLKNTVARTDISGGKDEKATVKWASKVAGDVLKSLL
jgi:nucleolar MIF4G domain-containing protein 1